MVNYKKHSLNFKLRLVKAYLNGGSYTGLAKVGGITRSLLKKWVGHYRQQGIEGLLPPGEQSYTREYKQEVVLVYQSSGLSLGECCFKYRIPSPSTLAGWIRQYEQFGIDGFSTARGRSRSMKSKPKIIKRYGPLTRLEELENENLRLRAENDLLKKLDALIREKEVAQKKKR